MSTCHNIYQQMDKFDRNNVQANVKCPGELAM